MAAAESQTISRYLESIYYMTAEGESVRAARLAEWMGVSQPTAGATLRRMVRDGLVSITAGKEIHLTARGQETAGRIVRRHRVAERWLTDVLGLDWVEADEEAGKLEHALSDEVAERLFEHIGRPVTCPHGNPIPGTEQPARRHERALRDLPPGARSRVRRVSEVAEHDAPQLLRFLGESGLHLGAEVEAAEHNPGAGTVTVKVGGKRVAMSLDVAGKIWLD
ncbi:MAG: DtxR family transcriptional regulator, Mn-dependent transcriptional regulator [Chloroflexota bacterium]|jgi:DtxR family Mn-dependent transcriptional regulator|nr:DtxR family transcriptional regulator, Mn-dependent transcriptional regulator [Chloroflexota bacterium]